MVSYPPFHLTGVLQNSLPSTTLLGAHCFLVMGSSTNEIEGLVRIKSMQLRFIPSDFGYPVTPANDDVISIWPLKRLFLEYKISL